jgi:cell division protein FtsL
MDRVQKINQAYSLTPWRKQLQRIGMFLVVLVVFALIAGVFLNVNARAATIGRQIQNYRNRMDELDKEIANQQSQLALLTSASGMEQRASALGFRHAYSDEILYMVVDGYNGRTPAVLASEIKIFTPSQSTPVLSSAFTQSLFDWIQQEFSLPPVLLESVRP